MITGIRPIDTMVLMAPEITAHQCDHGVNLILECVKCETAYALWKSPKRTYKPKLPCACTSPFCRQWHPEAE